MSIAIIRTRKLSTSGQMAGMQNHNNRSNNVLNADKDLQHLNRHYSKYGTNNIRQDIEKRIEEAGVNVKSNSVKCVELLLTASPDFFPLEKFKRDDGRYNLKGQGVNKWKEFEKRAFKFLKDNYGEKNVVNYSIHFDEKTPHIHAYVTPIIEKEVKWKNKRGSGVTKKNCLTAREIVGGKGKMAQLWTDFAEVMADIGLKRGREMAHATHQDVKTYYSKVNENKEFNKELDEFVPIEPDIDSLPKPNVFDRVKPDKYLESLRLTFVDKIKEAQLDGAQQVSKQFNGEFTRVLESQAIQGAQTKLINDLKSEKTQLEGVVDDLTAKNKMDLDRLEKTIDMMNNWRHFAERAVKYQDPEAIQEIMNFFNKPKDKGYERT